jgi:hypothetical protein
MREEDYTFVTIDSDDTLFPDAVIVDMDSDMDLYSAVVIDESMDSPDFITLSDETVMLSDVDMIDSYSSDIDDPDILIMI